MFHMNWNPYFLYLLQLFKNIGIDMFIQIPTSLRKLLLLHVDGLISGANDLNDAKIVTEKWKQRLSESSFDLRKFKWNSCLFIFIYVWSVWFNYSRYYFLQKLYQDVSSKKIISAELFCDSIKNAEKKF